MLNVWMHFYEAIRRSSRFLSCKMHMDWVDNGEDLSRVCFSMLNESIYYTSHFYINLNLYFIGIVHKI